MIKVNYKDKVFEVEEGISALDFIKNNIDVDLNTVMACKISNEVKSLDDANLKKDFNFDILDYTTADGSRIYVRGLTFIMLKAFGEVYPELKITVNYSLGHSVYCEAEDGAEITYEMIENVEKRMREIVNEDIHFEKRVLTIEEAKNLYEKDGRDDKLGIIGNRMKSHVSVYACG